MQDWVAKSNSRKLPKNDENASLRTLTSALFENADPSHPNRQKPHGSPPNATAVSQPSAPISRATLPGAFPSSNHSSNPPLWPPRSTQSHPHSKMQPPTRQTIQAKLDEAACNFTSGSALSGLCVKLKELIAAADRNLRALHADISAVAAQAEGPRRSHGIRLPSARRAPASLHRLRRPHRQAPLSLLRPARIRGPHRQLPRRRQGRYPTTVVVPFGSFARPGQRPRLPALLDRHHVRVHDARPLDEDLPQHPSSTGRSKRRQIQRDHLKGFPGNIPWGISESGFATTDAIGRYGYQAWGIPSLASSTEPKTAP